MRTARAGLLMMAGMIGSAQADTLELPSDFLSETERTPFRVCRAAVLIEASAPDGERTVLPEDVISMMREQITFIMSETIFSVPALSLKDGSKRVSFTEKFVIDFGKTIGTEMERLNDPARRAQALIECQPLIWNIMKTNLDLLMKWRVRAMGLDRPFPREHSVKPGPDTAIE